MVKSDRAALSNKEMASGYPESVYGNPKSRMKNKRKAKAKRGRSRM